MILIKSTHRAIEALTNSGRFSESSSKKKVRERYLRQKSRENCQNVKAGPSRRKKEHERVMKCLGEWNSKGLSQ